MRIELKQHLIIASFSTCIKLLWSLPSQQIFQDPFGILWLKNPASEPWNSYLEYLRSWLACIFEVLWVAQCRSKSIWTFVLVQDHFLLLANSTILPPHPASQSFFVLLPNISNSKVKYLSSSPMLFLFVYCPNLLIKVLVELVDHLVLPLLEKLDHVRES